MKFIRGLLFIPICILVIGLVYWAFAHLLDWFFNLSTLWLVVILIFFGGMIWGMFKGLSSVLMGLASSLSPSRILSFWVVLILATLNGVAAVYNSWTMDIQYSGSVIFASVIFNLLIFELTLALILGSVAADEAP